MTERWRDWPGVRASAFCGRALHLLVQIPTVSGTPLDTSACGTGTDRTDDLRRVNCRRCIRTATYRNAVERWLKEHG